MRIYSYIEFSKIEILKLRCFKSYKHIFLIKNKNCYNISINENFKFDTIFNFNFHLRYKLLSIMFLLKKLIVYKPKSIFHFNKL